MKSSVKLFKVGEELCEVLAFREVAEAADLPPTMRVVAQCCFTVPIGSQVSASEHEFYELVFPSGARFPIRICDVQLRFGGSIPSGSDVFAEVPLESP